MISYIIFMDRRGVTTRMACWGLTLFLFKLVLCQEDGPHQFPHRRLNRHKEFLGVSTEKERCQRRRGHLIQQFFFISWRCIQARASSYPNTPAAPRLFLFDMKLRGAERPKRQSGLTTAGSLLLVSSRRNRCPAQPWPSRPQAAALSTHSDGKIKRKE